MPRETINNLQRKMASSSLWECEKFTGISKPCTSPILDGQYFFLNLKMLPLFPMPNFTRPLPSELEICRRLAECRREAGFSQPVFAKLIGLTQHQLVNIEAGRTYLKFWIGWRVCQRLNLNPLYLAVQIGSKHPFPRIAIPSSIKPTASFGAVCTTTLANLLTQCSLKRNNTDVRSEQLPNLLARLNAVTQQRGKKAELAQFLEVPSSRVSEWLAGKKEPGGETTLQLLAWVEVEEAQQKSVSGTEDSTDAKTRIRKSSNEKPNSSPRKP